MKRLLLSLLATIALPTSVSANSMVNDALNSADQQFKPGMDGCDMVSLAIMAANWPEAYGETSSSLKAELKDCAKKCDLRY